MKRKEAIEILKLQISSAEFVAMYTHNDRDAEKELKNAEAFRMAIEALQAQPNHGRLIDADALIEDFNKLNEWLDLDEKAEIVSLINNAPIVQVEPKTGKWIKATGMMPPEFHGHHCCSECGNFANMEPPFGNREDLSKFCPNCGIRMLREDGGTE